MVSYGHFIVFLVLGAFAWAIYTFNRLVRTKQMKEEALSGIDVQLKRRADLVPRLVDIVKAYGEHEKKF